MTPFDSVVEWVLRIGERNSSNPRKELAGVDYLWALRRILCMYTLLFSTFLRVFDRVRPASLSAPKRNPASHLSDLFGLNGHEGD